MTDPIVPPVAPVTPPVVPLVTPPATPPVAPVVPPVVPLVTPPATPPVAPVVPPVTPPVTPPPTPTAKKPSPAAKALEAYKAGIEAKKASKPPKPGDVPADVAAAAKAWTNHVKTETARIAEAAKTLDADDQALINSEPDITRKTALLARFTKAPAAPGTPAKQVATPPVPGGPPSSSTTDFAAAWSAGPTAWAEVKARDAAGAEAWLTAQSAPTTSTSRNPFSTLFTSKKKA